MKRLLFAAKAGMDFGIFYASFMENIQKLDYQAHTAIFLNQVCVEEVAAIIIGYLNLGLLYKTKLEGVLNVLLKASDGGFVIGARW